VTRRSRRSKNAGTRRNRYGSRPMCSRPPLPIVVIVCDDARTAVSYFNVLKRLVKEKLTLTIVRNPHHRASAAEVVQCAEEQLQTLRLHDDDADQDSVWALIDREGTHDRQVAADNAKTRGEQSGVGVALSNPCYEVWTLLHLVDTGEAFVDCRAVVNRIEREWQARFMQPFRPKAPADYSRIVPNRARAAERARRHHQNGDPSWTEVYRVIEDIESA